MMQTFNLLVFSYNFIFTLLIVVVLFYCYETFVNSIF